MAKCNKETIKSCYDWIVENGLIDYGGAKLKDFCNVMRISNPTYYRWLENEEFVTAIKKAKEVFKENIEHDIVVSLAKAAKGYDFEEMRTEYLNKDGKPEIKKQIKIKKHVEVNVGAAIFLLTNIAPERWKNKQNKEISGELSTGINISVLDKSDIEEADELIKQLAQS